MGTRWGANLITKLALAAATSLSLVDVSSAADVSDSTGMYVGAFGGVGLLDETSMRQVGTVITPFIFPDINVDARGSADSVVAPIAGVQLGYEFSQWDVSASGWRVGMAAEIEGLYLGAEPKGVLDIDPQALGTHYVTLPGIGAGYGAVFINGSNSTNPSEPGINHFNSEPDASSGGLALQAKIGIRAAVTSNWSVFTEYRHVYIASTDYTFGQTDYPGEHLPTTKWNVDLGQQNYNLWVSGLSYRF